MAKGKVKKLVHDRGFGFIGTEDGKDIFFHQSGLVDVQYDALKEGQEVEYEVEESQKGPRAINVRVIGQ